MTGRAYEGLNRFMHTQPAFAAVVRWTERLITVIAFGSYPVFLVWCVLAHRAVLPRVVLVPLFGFGAVTAARYILKRPRPYELYAVTPLIKKDTVGRSFPSRHVFCIFMLAETYLYAASDPAALPFYAMGLLLMACRVLLGVHFIMDVTCGAVIALFCGLLYYF